MPAFIIFEDTISHVNSKDKTMRCHYIMTCIIMSTKISNQWVLSTVSRKAVNDHDRETTSLSHWRWNFHASINEVPSLTIKTVGTLLSKIEEQLSAILLEDKDNQGGTRVCISNEHQFVNREATKMMKGWREKNMLLSASSSPRSDGAKKS